jgi:gamma-glutamylcyclotransferase (GGCT)/AIG2-like uncharacterized protein YtfP
MKQRIFVYGTLLRGCTLGAHQRYLGQAHFIGKARLRAQLFRVGYYPALCLSEEDHWVIGEVYELTCNADLIALDNYEECSPRPQPQDEYRRAWVTAELETGAPLPLWTYVYQRSTAGLELIATGDFLSGA